MNLSNRHYLTASQHLLEKSQQTLKAIVCLDNLSSIDQIHHYSQHAVRQIDQIDRRVLKGESIPHNEKVLVITASG
ncbi:MAG: hypothetical protein L3J01_03970 [Thiomicrorhabdus sp.]|nr:hypothetical protein [Thiomicrorhabdus sp.]